MAVVLDPANNWCPEASDNVFSHLPPQDIAQCCQVSQGWRVLASRDQLWIQVVPNIATIVNANIKAYIDSHAVMSMEQLVDRVQAFASTVSSSGKFTCFFPFSSDSRVCVELELTNEWRSRISQNERELKEEWIFMKALDSDDPGRKGAVIRTDLAGEIDEYRTIRLPFGREFSLQLPYMLREMYLGIPNLHTYLVGKFDIDLPYPSAAEGEVPVENDISKIRNAPYFFCNRRLTDRAIRQRTAFFVGALAGGVMGLGALGALGAYYLYPNNLG